MRNRLVVCVNAKTYSEAVDQVKGAECAELRLDLINLSQNELGQLYLLCKEWIITPRQAYFKKDPELVLLRDLLKRGPLFLDVDSDLEAQHQEELYALAKENKVAVLASYHDYEKMPKLLTLKKAFQKMKIQGALAFKFALQAKTEKDLLELQELWKWDPNMMVFSMGKQYTFTRVAALFQGLKMMYVKKGGEAVASGQLSHLEAEMILKVIKG